jgi:copper(I)-binding protein
VSSSLRRGALAASAIAFSIAALSACAAGSNAQTLEVKPDNAETRVGDIKLQNVVVITQATPEASGETKGPAVVSATLFNSGDKPQTLDSVSVDGAGSAEITPAKGKGKGKVTVPAHGSVVLGGRGNASAAVKELGESVRNGNAQKVTFTFSTTGEVSLRAFVVPADSYYTKWGPSAVPSAPATSPKPTGSATPTGAATPTDAASASATATESAASH